MKKHFNYSCSTVDEPGYEKRTGLYDLDLKQLDKRKYKPSMFAQFNQSEKDLLIALKLQYHEFKKMPG